MTKNRRHPGLVCLAVGVFVLAGCQRDEIARYRVPKSPEVTGGPAAGPYRLLALMVPHRDKVYFIKLYGPEATVSPHADAFRGFVKSLRFAGQGAEPVSWTVPEKWRPGPARETRLATFLLGTDEPAPEVSVIELPANSGAASVLANVNRWRVQQLGLPAVDEAGLDKTVEAIPIDHEKGTLVDLVGTPPAASRSGGMPMGGGPGGGGPMGGQPRGGPVSPAGRATPPEFRTPDGWVPAEDRSGFSAATFRVTDAGASAEITAIRLGAGSGTLLQNVNRWRGQINLPPVDEEGMKQVIRTHKVDGGGATTVDLTGPDGPDRQRLIATIVPRGEFTWYFKIKGAARVVEAQRAAFEAFLGSVHFQNGKGANDG